MAFAGKEIQFKQRTTQSIICSTKVPTDGHDEEDTALADSVTTEQAIKFAGADSEVDSSDDDDEPVSEALSRKGFAFEAQECLGYPEASARTMWRLNLFSNPTDMIEDLLGLADFELWSQYSLQDKKNSCS